MRTNQATWVGIPAVPLEIHVNDFMGEPSHPFTPKEISENKTGKENGIWVKEPYIGIILGITEHAWRIDQLKSIESFFVLPAKGSGHVAMAAIIEGAGAGGQSIIINNHFNQKHLDWVRDVLLKFEALGVKTKDNDEGYDA
jgi:hypothetical protein